VFSVHGVRMSVNPVMIEVTHRDDRNDGSTGGRKTVANNLKVHATIFLIMRCQINNMKRKLPTPSVPK
jgi:hypothetical protein